MHYVLAAPPPTAVLRSPFEMQACLALANMAYVNQFAALRLLEAGADKAACDLIKDSDKTRHSDVMEAVRLFSLCCVAVGLLLAIGQGTNVPGDEKPKAQLAKDT